MLTLLISVLLTWTGSLFVRTITCLLTLCSFVPRGPFETNLVRFVALCFSLVDAKVPLAVSDAARVFEPLVPSRIPADLLCVMTVMSMPRPLVE